MARIAILTTLAIDRKNRDGGVNNVLSVILPALGFLQHQVEILPADPALLINQPNCDLVAIDGRKDLATAKNICKLVANTSVGLPIILISSDSSLPALSASWGFNEIILSNATVAEVESRLRILLERRDSQSANNAINEIKSGDVVIDEHTFTAKIRGRVLDLTYKEFELLKFLAQHPGRVFSRSQLLHEIWGYDYYGGTRTVDVHIRRLRSKLGSEEGMIGTVRNVGYRFNSDSADSKNDLVSVD